MKLDLLRDIAAHHAGDHNVRGVVLAAHGAEVHAEALGHLTIGRAAGQVRDCFVAR